MNEFDVKMGRMIRNGILAGLSVLLLSMTTCYTATKHYEYLNNQADRQYYLSTRPW